ncbi:MAG: hypothetical protein NVS3B19_16860 [Ginsengibacter sp.]
MLKKILTLLLLLSFFSCSEKKHDSSIVTIKTKFGNIDIKLFAQNAPKTVSAFLSFIDSGYYENSSFYRVLKEDNQPIGGYRPELIQGGIYKSNYPLSIKIKGIPHESTLESKLSHTNGTISLARTTSGSATTEFFICVGDQPSFNYGGDSNPDKLGYAAFGIVVKGMDVVSKIHHQPENGEDFDPQVSILNIVR